MIYWPVKKILEPPSFWAQKKRPWAQVPTGAGAESSKHEIIRTAEAAYLEFNINGPRCTHYKRSTAQLSLAQNLSDFAGQGTRLLHVSLASEIDFLTDDASARLQEIWVIVSKGMYPKFPLPMLPCCPCCGCCGSNDQTCHEQA